MRDTEITRISAAREEPTQIAKVFAVSSREILELLSYSDIGIIILDPNGGSVLSVNEVITKLCSPADGERLQVADLVFAEDLSKFHEEISAVRRHPEQPRHFRSAMTARDGVRTEVIVTSIGLHADPEKRIIVAVQDISGLVDVQRVANVATDSLLESEGIFQSLIRHVVDYAIFMLDAEGRVATWNIGAERLTGYDIGDVISRHFSLLFPDVENNTGRVIQYMRTAGEFGRSEEEMELLSKNGQRFWTRITITPLPSGDGNLTGYSVIVRDLTENRSWQQAVLGRESELHDLANHLEADREKERQRIARELHDEFGQMLTALRLDLSVLSRMISKTVDPVKQMPLMEKISATSQLVESTIRSTRRIITELRPAVLDELGLPTAILWQAQEFEDRTGIRCKIEALQHAVDLDERTSTAIFRIFQEALTNVARHSGATNAAVSAQVAGNKFVLKVTDDGVGIDQHSLRSRGSYGLLGIRERVAALGGTFDIRRAPGKGTALFVSVPYEQG